MVDYAFEIELPDLEPMSGRKSKTKDARKKELVKRILQSKEADVGAAKNKFRGKLLCLEVAFRLWKSDESHTDTTGKKDIDNLLKLVMDAIQTPAKNGGLGLIENDDQIFKIVATKKLVDKETNRGLWLKLSEMTENT